MNFNKLTKDQLIEKIKLIESQKSAITKKSLFRKFIEILVSYRNFVFRLTFVALTIKIFRKYSILSKIWRIINSIILSIFGISMWDIYGTDIFYNFFKELSSISGNIFDYLSTTHFYSILKNFFEKEVEKESEFPDETSENETKSLGSNNTSSQKISSGNNENQTISSRIGKIDENNQENNPFYKDKYFIFGAFLIISGLFLYFGFNASKPSSGDNFDNLNREQLQDRLQKLLDKKNISDNASDGSDSTITQVNNYFSKDKLTEDKLPEVNDLVQGSSSDFNYGKFDNNFSSRSTIPTILLASRFLEPLDSEKEIKDDIQKQENHEVIIQDDDSENIIDTWDKVEVKFLNGDNLNILFGKMSKDSKSILINTSNNDEIIYDLSFNLINNYTNDNFNWRFGLKSKDPTVKINEIMIKDLENNYHLIYSDDELK